jgi:hypothetical protein
MIRAALTFLGESGARREVASSSVAAKYDHVQSPRPQPHWRVGPWDRFAHQGRDERGVAASSASQPAISTRRAGYGSYQ